MCERSQDTGLECSLVSTSLDASDTRTQQVRKGGIMPRAITCPCGHKMEAQDDNALYMVVRSHVDKEHPELNYSRENIETMIRKEARDARTT